MKWLHNLLKGVSLSTALFIFQACYGTGQNPMFDERGEAPMTFVVRSASSGELLKGVVISGSDNDFAGKYYQELGVTDAEGRCKVSIPYYRNAQGPWLKFEDPSGTYEAKDTVLFDLRERDIEVRLSDVK